MFFFLVKLSQGMKTAQRGSIISLHVFFKRLANLKWQIVSQKMIWDLLSRFMDITVWWYIIVLRNFWGWAAFCLESFLLRFLLISVRRPCQRVSYILWIWQYLSCTLQLRWLTFNLQSSLLHFEFPLHPLPLCFPLQSHCCHFISFHSCLTFMTQAGGTYLHCNLIAYDICLHRIETNI